jgi:hypothetical protein
MVRRAILMRPLQADRVGASAKADRGLRRRRVITDAVNVPAGKHVAERI